MGKDRDGRAEPTPCVEQKLTRFAEIEPANGACRLLPRHGYLETEGTLIRIWEPLRQVESLLTKP